MLLLTQRQNGKGDFLCLSVENKKLVFTYFLGHGTARIEWVLFLSILQYNMFIEFLLSNTFNGAMCLKLTLPFYQIDLHLFVFSVSSLNIYQIKHNNLKWYMI